MEKKKKKLEAKDRLDLLKMSREEHDRYRRDLSDAASFLHTQQRKEEIAREEGIIQVARNLKANGVAIEIISKSTGLTTDKIEEL